MLLASNQLLGTFPIVVWSFKAMYLNEKLENSQETMFIVFADYQGLTRSFCHGKIYCSLITAKLVNLKIGIPWDSLHVLPLNQKICIAGVDVTCLDANHCPGSIIILFEPPNGKVCPLRTLRHRAILYFLPNISYFNTKIVNARLCYTREIFVFLRRWLQCLFCKCLLSILSSLILHIVMPR